MKKLFIFIALSLSMLGLTACKSEFDRETARIAQYFDLSVPQEIWDGNFPRGFFEDIAWTFRVIRITFRPFKEGIETIPDIELHHLGIRRAETLSLGSGGIEGWRASWELNPSIIMFGTILFPVEYLVGQMDRQEGERLFIPAIRQLESLPFIQTAIPVLRHPMWLG